MLNTIRYSLAKFDTFHLLNVAFYVLKTRCHHGFDRQDQAPIG